ncbi:MAG TPA: acyl-ACP thioesterase domain-containing protein [Ktedonobacteraceae bacterium]|nr:acyl-ACP thioesterase domain-containing protein [Ktedonobacteraceae bacterium]
MTRQYCLTHTVRYDECNCDNFLTPAAFVRYMQNIASRDAEDAGLVTDGYWIVKRTIMSFARPIPMHSALEIKTFGLNFTRITAQRGYEARLAGSPHSEPLISAHSLWVYVDHNGRPARLPEGTAQIWQPDDGATPPSLPAFPGLPDQSPITTSTHVHFSEIDLMQHLNNASSIEILDNAGWESLAKNEIVPGQARFTPLHYDVEYVDSPRFGEHLEIQSWFEPFPSPGQEFTRLQQITRAGKTMLRTRSHWFWENH